MREVRYASRDPAAGSTELLRATPYMRRREVRVVGPEWPELEAAIMAMHVEYSLRTYGEAAGWLLSTWEAAAPADVRLGRTLHGSGQLPRLRDAGAAAREVVDRLAGMARGR